MKKIFLFFFISISCFAQFSKTHYIPPLTAASPVMVNDHYLYISTPNKNNVPFKIIQNGGTTISGVVSNTTPYVYTIGSDINSPLFTPKTTIGKISNKGYTIEAEDLVYVSVRVNSVYNNSNGGYNHAGGLVSKGNSALGKSFRLGGMLNPNIDASLLNFASILATENNTKVTLSNFPVGTLFTDGTTYTIPIEITLNKNESYVIALENYAADNTPSNCSKMIGALVESDKSVVVNSGSFGGSNISSAIGRDVGFDQIVSFEKTGKEYIFVKGVGTSNLEIVLLIAQIPNTIIYLNGNTTPFTTLVNPGDYIVIDGNQFINGNLYVKTSENVFAYQSIGGDTSPANQNLFFVPPLNCATPNTVDNIPFIQSIGNITFDGNVNIVTEVGAVLKINGINTTSTPIAIVGNPGFERYSISGLSGNVAINSTKQVYVSYFGTNFAATFGGYYSGFDLKPELVSDKITLANSSCIPNVILKINTLSSYKTFQWYENDVEIPGETSSQYRPIRPGYYQVRGGIPGCPSNGFVFSDKIPVSECPTNLDNDKACDNIDLDNDNDGILNCTESYGNLNIDISNSSLGNISQNSFSNSFSGITSTTGNGLPIGTFTGSIDGSFITEIPSGKANTESNSVASSITYKMTFAQPMSVGIEYVSTANISDLMNTDAEYVINSDINKTITVLNPDNQLLIDTNYDGIYETGITEYSSFEIRFRLNSTTPLTAGTGTFKFSTYLVNSISFTHKNLSDTLPNKSTFKFFAICIPKDSDLDGIPDQLDTDSDNDGILDTIEAQENATISISNSDTNNNGLDNAFETGFSPIDTDLDGVMDYLDLDSDNDGILDSVETGNDFDTDGTSNYRDLDSDQDLCSDVIEAGFLDPDSDGKFGNSPIAPDSKGLVIGAPYTTPNPNYLIAAPIVITTQPAVAPTCELQKATISIVDNGGNTYQWQLSTDGLNWTNLNNNVTYADVTTKTLTINSVTNAMNGYKYRVQLSKTGNSCGLISAETTLIVYVLPVVNDITIIQCDDDLDLKTLFNLTIKNNSISANAANENFSYFYSRAGANTADATQLINNFTAFPNTTSPMDVWVRVTNKNNCFSVAKLTLVVAASQFPPTYSYTVPAVCDDTLAADGTVTGNPNINKRDGISAFDLRDAIKDIESKLPPPLSNYTIKYYRNKADGLLQNDTNGNSLAINPTEYANFRNDIPNVQNIWVRVNNNLTSDCGFGFGDYIKLSLEKLPFANPVPIFRQCDDNQDDIFNFDTSNLEIILKGTNQSFPVTVTYFDATNNPLKDAYGVLIKSPFPNIFFTKSQTIKAVVTNNTTQKCFDEKTIQFIVDKLPIASLPFTDTRIECDDEKDPLVQNGIFKFTTPNLENDIKGTQTNVAITYFDELGNPLLDILGNPIISPFPNTFETKSRTIKAVVTSTITNTSCPSKSIDIPFIVKPLPKINLNTNGNDDKLVCQNDPIFYVQLDAGIQDGTSPADYTYVWSKDGTILVGKTDYTLNVNEDGLYTVEVLNSVGCSRIRTIKVTASDFAKIDSIDIDDMADTNTVTVYASGKGDYEYSLDEPSGYFQDSNIFTNVTAGIHDVYVNDKKGCGIVKRKIAVVGVPKFFTPNGDGYNDYWSVKGVNATFYSNSIIYIFDRYGKLLKQWVPSTSQGWDGTFNGNPMPGDDYWYTIKLEDGREAKGHFSLKR